MAEEVKQQMEGKWIVYKSEDFGKYLDKLGVGMIKKKMATSMTPKLTITVEGDVITTKIEAGLKTNLNSFKIGEEYEIEMEQGTSKALSIWEDGKLKTTITPKDSNKKEQQVVREVVAGEIIQGYHFKCLLCKKIPKYFKAKYDVRRHLQDQHSGVGFQCSLCGYLFNRRSMKHSCNASEEDMEYVTRLTGEYGEEAKQKLHSFINEEQDGHWEYVTYDEYTEEHTRVRSKVVKKMEPPIVPRSREECVSPISMAEPDISLEEPPRIVKQLETSRASSPTLSDISSLSSYRFSSSSGSSSSCSCSDSEADSDNDDNDWSKKTESVVEVKRNKRTEMKANEERVTEKETGREKNNKDKNNSRKDNGKENKDRKEKCRDSENQKSKERSKKVTNEIQNEMGKSNVKEKEKVQGKEIEKDKETEKVCNYEKVKGGNTKEKEPEKNKKVNDRRKETEKLSANGENVKENEVKSNENERRKQNEKENTCKKNKGTNEKEKNSNIKQKETKNGEKE